MKKLKYYNLKFSTLICFIFLSIGALHGQKVESHEPYHGLQLLIANPSLQLKRIQPDFGHEASPSKAFPIQLGVGWMLQGKKGIGARLGLSYLPLNFDIDYNYQANPDPLIPAFSEFRNDYLMIQAQVTVAFLRKEKFEFMISGGLDFALLMNYSENTVFSNGDLDSDRFREFFSNFIGGAELCAGGRYFLGERLFVDLQAGARLFTAPLESLEFTDLKNLSLCVQGGFGFKLKGK